jgi:nucleoid DNA-binding protein
MPDLKQELVDKLSIKYHLSKKEVLDIVDHQYRFTAKVISDGKFNSVRLPYFGIFKPNMKRKKHYDDRKNESK